MKIVCALLLSGTLAAAAAVEPKLPISAGQELKVSQDAASITVSGETFSYVFSKANGLIQSVRVTGREITEGTPVPDLALAEHLDRTFSPYSARRETAASVSVDIRQPYRVVIHSSGGYVSEAGQRFPLRFSITYDIGIDGVVLVEVKNTAIAPCTFRWLTLSGGAVRPSLAKFISWMPDQAARQTSGYEFKAVPAGENEKVLAGTFIPWFWVGDERVGIEVTTWEVNSQTYLQVDGTSRRDQHEMFVVRREANAVRWVNYLVGGSTIFAKPGWQTGGEFALAITPARKFDPSVAMLKGAHMGPHQHRPSVPPYSEDQIRTLAQNGYNLLVGVANWRSGDYVPLNDADVRKTIALCHKYGIKVIPYITFVDLSHASDAFREHGEEWAIEPTTENFRLTSKFHDINVEMAYRNDPEQETTLMCPGSAGWRDYWKRQIDRTIANYDFDGLYIDFWFGRMACENRRHGCGGRFRKFTILGHRDMLAYAWNKVKAKNPGSIIKVNTNLLATAMLTSMVDLRLVGEARDAAAMDPLSRQWLYSSIRLGEPTEFLWAGTRWDDRKRAWFAALTNFLPQYYFRPKIEPRTGYDDFDVFRYFEADRGEWSLGILGHDKAKVSPPEVVTNVVERPGARLVTLINNGSSGVNAVLSVEGSSLVYEPLAEKIVPAAGGVAKLDLAESGYRHVVMTGQPAAPALLFVLGARGQREQKWDPKGSRLEFSVDAVEGARLRYAIYSPRAVKRITDHQGATVTFQWSAEAGLAVFEAVHREGARFTTVY